MQRAQECFSKAIIFNRSLKKEMDSSCSLSSRRSSEGRRGLDALPSALCLKNSLVNGLNGLPGPWLPFLNRSCPHPTWVPYRRHRAVFVWRISRSPSAWFASRVCMCITVSVSNAGFSGSSPVRKIRWTWWVFNKSHTRIYFFCLKFCSTCLDVSALYPTPTTANYRLWFGGVCAPNGKIFLMPWSTPNIGVVRTGLPTHPLWMLNAQFNKF